MQLTLAGQLWQRRALDSIVINGKEQDGDCDHDAHIISVRRGQRARDELDTDLHEVLHAMFPHWREWFVERTANELTALLYDKLKYRRR